MLVNIFVSFPHRERKKRRWKETNLFNIHPLNNSLSAAEDGTKETALDLNSGWITYLLAA